MSLDSATPLPAPESRIEPARLLNLALFGFLMFVPLYYGYAVLVRRSASFFYLVKVTYQFGTVVYPVMAIGVASVCMALWFRTRNNLWRRTALLQGLAALALVLVRLYATHIEPSQLRLRKVTIVSDKVDREIRLLHISDFQTGRVGSHEIRTIERIREINPDLIIHTGDLIHPVSPATYESEFPIVEELFASLTPPLGKFNVIGDVDGEIRELLEQGRGGMTTLINQDTTIEVGGTRLRLLGLSKEMSKGGELARLRFAPWLEESAKDDFTILFGHRPDFAIDAKEFPIDLCLAGHTHGGQVRVPFFGPIVTLTDVPRAMARGFHEWGKTHLNVSAGIGAEHAEELPSIRINCPPEMTLITIKPRSSGTP